MATSASVRVTPERVIAVAVELTAAHGVEGWTVRQLAGGIGVYPAVVYHHVGDREAVVAGVLDVVLGRVEVPGAAEWRPWFEELAERARCVLRRYPGAARRLAVSGYDLPSAGGLVDSGISMLRNAGFGAESARVYTFLFEQVCALVALEDDRSARAAARAEDASRDPITRDDAAGVGRYLRERTAEDAFHYAFGRVLDGVAATRER